VEGVLRYCDRVALLEGGLLRFVGAPQSFRSSVDPLVRAFYDREAAAAAARELASVETGG
jgi:ABC-type transporter Mla maintaining outer membrane lipid asymmetry ATPase subunit MlaF